MSELMDQVRQLSEQAIIRCVEATLEHMPVEKIRVVVYGTHVGSIDDLKDTVPIGSLTQRGMLKLVERSIGTKYEDAVSEFFNIEDETGRFRVLIMLKNESEIGFCELEEKLVPVEPAIDLTDVTVN